jgi:hypothetical protein
MKSALQLESITNAEHVLSSFTHKRHKTLDTWPLWHANGVTQLDQLQALGMFGKPCYQPKDSILLNSHWKYRIKQSRK